MSDAFIIDGVRTPIGRYGGALAQVRTDDLAAHALNELMKRFSALPADCIDDIVLGCANQAGEDNRNVARMAALLAGLPISVPGTTINRLCGSGLDAVGYAARMIRTSEADLVIAGGVESMTRAPLVLGKAEAAFQRGADIHDTTIGWRFVNPLIERQYGIESMPETAENVAAEFGISRADQDAFALRSQVRAAAAQASGRFGREIVAVPVKERNQTVRLVERDEHPRSTTLEKLAELPALFKKGGTVTAGNASGINDGAAALLLASERAISKHGLTPLAKVTGMATAGVPPRIMGMGPVAAVRKLLERTSLGISAFDVIEINEAFAAQVLACSREIGLSDDADHVNPNGGAIALGHPLGMSGARLALTAALELAVHGGQRALATMCIGVGQGIALSLGRV